MKNLLCYGCWLILAILLLPILLVAMCFPAFWRWLRTTDVIDRGRLAQSSTLHG